MVMAIREGGIKKKITNPESNATREAKLGKLWTEEDQRKTLSAFEGSV